MSSKTRGESLNKRLQLLYEIGINSSIKSHSDLSVALGLSRQAISKWIHGTETQMGDHIPSSKLEAVATVCGIPAEWFALPLESFEIELRQKKNGVQELEPAADDDGAASVFISMLPMTDLQAVGRDQELQTITKALKSSEVHIVQIAGFGGMGKSTLVNCWLRSIAAIDYLGARRVFAWSFVWQGTSDDVQTSADLFIESALEWFGDELPTSGSLWSKVNRLVAKIRSSRTVLILDAIEALLSPPGAYGGRIEDRGIALLIRELATSIDGLCIITSRFRMTETERFYTSELVTIGLEQLSQPSAITMLRELGVKGSDDLLSKLVDRYDRHPLSLKLLGGYLTTIYSGTTVGYLAEIRIRFDFEKIEPFDNLMQSYKDWIEDRPELAVLYLLSLFDKPVNLDMLWRVSAGLGDNKLFSELGNSDTSTWRLWLKSLSESGLITVQEAFSGPLLHCHPLVRSSFSTTFQTDARAAWLAAHEVIYGLLSCESTAAANSRHGFEPLVQAIYHGCMAGKYLEAFDIFRTRIKQGQVIDSALHSHNLDLDCMAPFFQRRWAVPRKELPIDARDFLLACATANLIYHGKLEDALEPSVLCVEGFILRKDWVNAISSAAQITSSMIYLGRLSEAENQVQNFAPVIGALGNQIALASEKCFKGYIHHLKGEHRVADELFEQAYLIYGKQTAADQLVLPIIHHFYSAYLINTRQHDRALQHAKRVMDWREENSWQTSVDITSLLALDNSFLGLAYLVNDNTELAQGYLDKSVTLLRDVEDWMYLPEALNHRGLGYAAIKDYHLAIADLEESIDICRSTGSRISEWNAHINYCLVEIQRGSGSIVQAEYDHAQQLLKGSEYRMRDADLEFIECYLSNRP